MAHVPRILPSSSAHDPVAMMNTYQSYLSMLIDPNANDESKLKAAQELSRELEAVVANPMYPSFLDIAVDVFIRILDDGEPHFIVEHKTQQLRKLILQIVHSLPVNYFLQPHVNNILQLMFKLLEIENEENVLVVLGIITQFHKTYRPQFCAEVIYFLQYVKNIYSDLPNHFNTMFESHTLPKIEDLSLASLDPLLRKTFTSTVVYCEGRGPDGSNEQYNLIPHSTKSLKVLAQLPGIVILMNQLYTVNIHEDVMEFIHLAIITITLQPSSQQRKNQSFNKEVFVDFIAAQIKTLSFVADTSPNFQRVVNEQSSQLVKSMIGLLCICPQEVAHLRKELLELAGCIPKSQNIVESLEELLDENILIGSGWTANECLRPLAFNTMADFVHHSIRLFSLHDLSKAVTVFSRNVHDESLVTIIQRKSCILLHNLVECIHIQSDSENENGRQLLIRILEVLVLKFKTIAKFQLPILMAKYQEQTTPASARHLGPGEMRSEPEEETKSTFQVGDLLNGRDVKTKFGFPASPSANYTVSDCRSQVKILICCVKTVTWGMTSCKVPADGQMIQDRQLQPEETQMFIRLIKYSLQVLDIYTLTPISGYPQPKDLSVQTERSKEEKEVLGNLAGLFMMMHPMTFQEVFSTVIDYVVDSIYKNSALHVLAEAFFTKRTLSPIFGTILVEHLLKRMEEMGSNMDRCNLYLKLFKLIFDSVSWFPTENVPMLKPYLHRIVNNCMELALNAKEPYNYFLLLRALFRFMKEERHDLLDKEFLLLLPNLLQDLNNLQSGFHKQHIKDLLVELCLAVPVNLYSLLPYLHMVMGPLVSALNGSHTLVSQAICSLEVFVDHLKPEILYDLIQPVRVELMQALWRIVRNCDDSPLTQAAFRVLGKFGGENRKMMAEPQKLDYTCWESVGPCVAVHFQEHMNSISLPVGKVIETALNALKTSTIDLFYHKHSWEIVKGFLCANIVPDDEIYNLQQLFAHPSFSSGEIPPSQTPHYLCMDVESRRVHEMALTGMFVAAAIEELHPVVFPFMVTLVRHYTLVAISQQAGPFSAHQKCLQGMDPLVLVDAIAAVMGFQEKKLCELGTMAITFIIDTAATVLNYSLERACSLPIVEYLAEKLSSLCYDRAWYAKLGGCHAICHLYEITHAKWVYAHMYVFLKAFLFVMMDLTGEVSSGAVDQAKMKLEVMLTNFCKPCNSNDASMVEAQANAINDVVQELVRQLTQPNTCVRKQVMHSLCVISEVGGKSVTQIIEPYKDLLTDYVPLENHIFQHQPILCQIGLLDANTFCMNLKPRLFSYDLSNSEHKKFLDELIMLCEYDDATLQNLPCYKGLSNLIPLRKAMLHLLSTCHYIVDMRDGIFQNLCKALRSPLSEMQDVGYQCIQHISEKYDNTKMIRQIVQPLVENLIDHHSLSLPVIQQLSYLSLLFPKLFSENMCVQLLSHLSKCMEEVVRTKEHTDTLLEVKICCGIINIYHQIPVATARFIDPLVTIILNTEKYLLLEAGSPFREPLVLFLKKFPQQTIDHLFFNQTIQDKQRNRFLEYLLKGAQGKCFRDILQQSPSQLVAMTIRASSLAIHDIQFQMIHIVSILIKYDDQWLSKQHQLVTCLRKIWTSKQFHERHFKLDSVDFTQWKEPKLLAKCLLNFVKHHPNEIELLFQLLRAFTGRFIPDFEFLREFLKSTVANNYTVDWKRMAFFKFVEIFDYANFPQDLKAKILQYILIPSFVVAFEKGEGERLIGGHPSPEQDLIENVMSVFINRVIDDPFVKSDAVRIMLLQFSCLLVEQASQHIHDSPNIHQGNKFKKLMKFSSPCLLTKNCVDLAIKYYGHLLLANIIAKFRISKKIVLQVFHNLLKEHSAEAFSMVYHALDILIPAIPMCVEDGYNMLAHWTRNIIEETHTLAQLIHILRILVRHYKVYYSVRHHLIYYMVSSIEHLASTSNATLEHKRLALDLANVIILWEIQRHKEEQEEHLTGIDLNEMDNFKPVDKEHADSIVNFLFKMSCLINGTLTTSRSTRELLSRQCLALLKTVLMTDVWPNAELNLVWCKTLLFTVRENPQPNFRIICTFLDLLALLLPVLRIETILATFRYLEQGIGFCLSCRNPEVIQSVHDLLFHLMCIIPSRPINTVYEDMLYLYNELQPNILNTLNNQERQRPVSSSELFGTLKILKSACDKKPCYIDYFIPTFLRVLDKLVKEHLQPPTTEINTMATKLLILILDLLKNRVCMMNPNCCDTFIGTVLIKLIEKSPDVKVLMALTKVVEDWVKNKSTCAVIQYSSIQKKSYILVKMMHFFKKRFPDDLDLNTQFLELVHYVYNDESLRGTELQSKLDPVFMNGLCCVQPHIRQKFFEVLDMRIHRRLNDRLLYIACFQNWKNIGLHFWIKQCIELLFVTAVDGMPIQNAIPNGMLPAVTSVIEQADFQEQSTCAVTASIKEELMGVTCVEAKEDRMDMDLSAGTDVKVSVEVDSHWQFMESKESLLLKAKRFQEGLREIKTQRFLGSVAQLCHMDIVLAQYLWIELFPRLWKILNKKQQTTLSPQLVAFVCSGLHVLQKDCHPSAMSTFFEGMCQCLPPIHMPAHILKHIGKSYNMWHCSTLLLEKICFAPDTDTNDCESDTPLHSILDNLSEMYSLLKEEDMLCGLWKKYSKYPEISIALTLEQQGLFPQAVVAYKQVIEKHKQANHTIQPSPLSLQCQSNLYWKQLNRSYQELNKWDDMHLSGLFEEHSNAFLILEHRWRQSNWIAMKEVLHEIEKNCPRELLWKMCLYKGYLYICHPEACYLKLVDNLVKTCSDLCINEWRRLPHIVSHMHLPILQATQQVIELLDANQIHQYLLPANIEQETSLCEIKLVLMKWQNRLPVISDDLSYWSEILYFRQKNYQMIASGYESVVQNRCQQLSHSIQLGIHDTAQSIIQYGKIARKHGLTEVCLNALERIHSIPSVPIVDSFQKIRQQIKCFLQIPYSSVRPNSQESLSTLDKAMNVFNSINTNLCFTKEMTAELLALHGVCLTQGGLLGKALDDFRTSFQIHDKLVNTWAQWGEYLEHVFTNDNLEIRHMGIGVSVLTSFLKFCCHQNESKSRKYLAKVLWLLTYDNEDFRLNKALDEHGVTVPTLQWLPWIPQLLTCLVRNEGHFTFNLISKIGKTYPQAIYFPIHNLYLNLKKEQREKYPPSSTEPSESAHINATQAILRCSHIMNIQRDTHPTLLFCLDGIVDQMVWFRENIYEEVLHQLRQVLAKCYSIAYENAGDVSKVTVTPHILNFMKKLLSIFGGGMENVSSVTDTISSSVSESLSHRVQATEQISVFQKMKEQLTTDFDFNIPGSMKLQNLICKLKKWVKILEAKTELLHKSFLIEEKCRFLNYFIQKNLDIEIPGEFLLPKHNHSFVHIAKFMPQMDIVQKHNRAARRLYIKGHNGKIYPYLVVNDSCLMDGPKEERVLQLLRMLNHVLGKQKETSRRFLNFTIPRVVPISPHMRLVEDNPSSVSLLDIYKQHCTKCGIEYDAPLDHFYERLATVQTGCSMTTQQDLRDILKDIQNIMVPKTMLKKWVQQTYPQAVDYWTFRKQFTLQLALASFIEYVLHLTPLNPDMIYIHQNSGLMNVSYFRFCIMEATGDKYGQLYNNRPIPFRLTPNISEFVTAVGIVGPFTASLVAAAHCLTMSNFKITSLLKAILRDEMIDCYKKRQDDNQVFESLPNAERSFIINNVNKGVEAILARLKLLATFEESESKATMLVTASKNPDNLCHMDPSWHPWL